MATVTVWFEIPRGAPVQRVPKSQVRSGGEGDCLQRERNAMSWRRGQSVFPGPRLPLPVRRGDPCGRPPRAGNRDRLGATPPIPRHVAAVEHGMAWFEMKRAPTRGAPTFNAFPSRGGKVTGGKVTVPFRAQRSAQRRSLGTFTRTAPTRESFEDGAAVSNRRTPMEHGGMRGWKSSLRFSRSTDASGIMAAIWSYSMTCNSGNVLAFLRVCRRLIWLAPLWFAPVSGAGEARTDVFESSILPIIENKCVTCHGESAPQAELDLRAPASILKGGKSGPAVVPGSADRSLLLDKVVSGAMPPGDAALSREEVAAIRGWIDRLGQAEAALAHAGISEKDVLPIFLMRCVVCHGKRAQEGGLDLRTLAGRLRGGKSGPALVPGDPDASLLFQRIVKEEMPPADLLFKYRVRPPSTGEVETVRRWIAAGALADPPHDPGQDSDRPLTDEDRRFWSFRSPESPPVPEVGQGRPGAESHRRLPAGEAGGPRPELLARGGPPHPPAPGLPGPHRHAAHRIPGPRLPGGRVSGRVRAHDRGVAGIAPLRGALGPALAGRGRLRRHRGDQARRPFPSPGLALPGLRDPLAEPGQALRPLPGGAVGRRRAGGLQEGGHARRPGAVGGHRVSEARLRSHRLAVERLPGREDGRDPRRDPGAGLLGHGPDHGVRPLPRSQVRPHLPEGLLPPQRRLSERLRPLRLAGSDPALPGRGGPEGDRGDEALQRSYSGRDRPTGERLEDQDRAASKPGAGISPGGLAGSSPAGSQSSAQDPGGPAQHGSEIPATPLSEDVEGHRPGAGP